ncbi:hypothetical protein DDI74_13890 [Chryseobacterium gleum]|nr:hypothetical protein DDI74_13890 [Chryseobacterium gleum]
MIMKKIIIHSVPVAISLIWLWTTYQTFNPIALKGPDFLKFYILLILSFFTSTFILNFFREKISEVTFYFSGFIFLLGIIKLIRGVVLERPVGFLVMILIAECIVTLVFMSIHFNKKIK